MVAPVTTAPPVPCGSPSRSRTQRRAASSNAAATGDITRSAAFWSQAEASHAAPTEAGTAAPFTKPKNRPPAVATVAGEPARSNKSTTAQGSHGSSGNGPPNSSKPRRALSPGATLLAGISCR